jgi:competence protein ComFC
LIVLTRAIHNLRDGFLSLAYPQECRICSRAVESWGDGVICSVCWGEPSITRLFIGQACCLKCNAPLPKPQSFPALAKPSDNLEQIEKTAVSRAAAASIIANEPDCGQCNTMPFTFARACGAYAGGLAANVLFLKTQPHVCRRLRDLLQQTFAANRKHLLSDVVMPVPLHPARKLERGFNQAELIARVIASHFDLRLDVATLKRAKNTERHRAGMDAIDRRKSVERAFQVARAEAIQQATVLLIDDVFTTGSTICAAAKTLLAAGAAQVRILTIAKVTGVVNRKRSSVDELSSS